MDNELSESVDSEIDKHVSEPEVTSAVNGFNYANNSNKYISLIVTFFVVFAIYFVFSIFICNVLLTPLSVLGYSMSPTLNADAEGTRGDKNTDVVYIELGQSVEINDIIVFDASSIGHPNDYYIKRVIAVAGDRIRFVSSSNATENNTILTFTLLRNDVPIDESYASEMLMRVGYPERTQISGTDNYKQVISESEITIPPDYVFVMGDNRTHSTDSREFGVVPVSAIIGKVRIHVKRGQNLIFAIVHSIKNDYLF